MDIKSKSSHKLGVWLVILAVVAASAATLGLYPYMKARAGEYSQGRMTSIMKQNDYSGLATQVMNFSYEIWHLQKQEEEGRILTYSQTFLPGLDEKIQRVRTDGNDGTADTNPAVLNGNVKEKDGVPGLVTYSDDSGEDTLDYYQRLQSVMNKTGSEWERYFQKYNSILSYGELDDDGGFLRSNETKAGQFFDYPLVNQAGLMQFTVEFSNTGSLKLYGFKGSDEDASRLLQAMNRYEYYDPLTQRMPDDYHYSDIKFSGPKNMKIIFRCVPAVVNAAADMAGSYGTGSASYIESGGYYAVVGGTLFVLALIALALPAVKRLEIGRSALCRLSFEPLCAIGTLWCILMGEGSIPGSFIAATMDKTLRQELLKAELLPWSADVVSAVINLAFWIAVYGLFYWGITCLRAIFSLGPWRYFTERTWTGRFLRFIKRWACNALNVFNETDWENRSTRIIGRAVIGNFIILALISCLWFWGIGALIIYSIIMFFMLRKYWGEMQKKYRMLLDGINQIAEGNLDVEIKEDLGVFNPFKEQLSRIQEGFKKTVDQEVRSERTKSELITNVSHDLKTPLTAIITYVNLLKQASITKEERDSYIKVLDQKSMRLKILIDDLFEVSKANSGTVTLHPENVDIISLLKQIRFELSDKMEESGIEFKFNLPEERVILYLDSQKTYRIFENLLVNIAKYGMAGTRAYIQVVREEEGYVGISMRNVSARELNVAPEELTERFVRGDSARNTEGSGLGLAIARSFVEVQGGTMKIEVEDDLFRVNIRWKEEAGEQEQAADSPV